MEDVEKEQSVERKSLSVNEEKMGEIKSVL